MPKKGAKKKGAKKGPSKAEKAAAALEAEAKAMFKAIDTDGDGSLSPWEVNLMVMDYGLGDEEMETLFELVDTDGNGEIDEAEWIAGYAAFQQMVSGQTKLSPLEKCERALREGSGAKAGSVTIDYEAYSDTFETRGGVLSWQEVDNRYSVSFLFKGDFGKALFRPGEAVALPMVEHPRGTFDICDEFDETTVLATQKVAYFYNLEDKARLQMKVSESDLGLGVDGLTLSKGGITSAKGVGLEEKGIKVHTGGLQYQSEEGCSCIYGTPCNDNNR